MFLFLLAPLAVVVILGQQAQVFVLLLPGGGLDGLLHGFGLGGVLFFRLRLLLALVDLVEQDLRLFGGVLTLVILLAHRLR